jgi:hypothetical protein
MVRDFVSILYPPGTSKPSRAARLISIIGGA